MTQPPIFLGFDFGGTKLTAVSKAIHSNDLTFQAQRRVFSPPDGDAQFDIDTMIALGHELAADHPIAAIGVSFGGPTDHAAGTVLLSHHVAGWENTPLQQVLAQAFAAPVAIDNDANVAALGEWRFGAGQGVDNLLYVTVSTGVGGGWILHKRPFRGHQGLAGEIGHTVVDPAGPRCLCGKRGCVERLASGPYMAQDLAAALNQPNLTGHDVARLAAAGQPDAVRILERGAMALGVGLGNAINLINPERVVLGGGVTKSGERWWERVRQSAASTTLPELEFTIVPAQLGDDAPLWGAIALAQQAQT